MNPDILKLHILYLENRGDMGEEEREHFVHYLDYLKTDHQHRTANARLDAALSIREKLEENL